MPKALEKRLMAAADKMAKKGKLSGTKEGFVYGTMTNMMKKGSIEPWRKLKAKGHASRKT